MQYGNIDTLPLDHGYGDVQSLYDGPRWLMTISGLQFDVPFTRHHLQFGPAVSALLTWVTSLLFVILVCYVFPKLKPKDPATLKKIAFWHYFGLCVFSAIASGSTLYLMFSRGEHKSWSAFLCNLPPDWYRALSIAFTLSKYWEWLDTAILVWKGKSIKEIGFLHFYHHMTTVWLFSYTMNFPGTEKIGLLLNGFVHTLMYYHYAFRLPMAFRPIITIAQIIQLAFGTWSHHPNVYACKMCTGYLETHTFDYIVPYLFVPVYLLAFCHFFYISYVAPPKRASKPAATDSSAPVANKKKD